MDLILTHEQTDLDGLASMLGAHLLRPEAIALLPRQINRNGKAFLRRYANELPFSDYQALPHESISSVFLVDTQSLVTLRGMNEQTNVTVLDHHPRKVQIHPNWQVELHLTGACTTILVEKLKEQNITLSPIEATLMLLGIYEDTGSLTYSCTTPADARAVAFLLEQGAALGVEVQQLAGIRINLVECFAHLLRCVEKCDVGHVLPHKEKPARGGPWLLVKSAPSARVASASSYCF